MSLFSNPLILSCTVGLLIFLISYLQSDRILKFFSEKTLGLQTEILELMEKLLITQDKKKFTRNAWVVSSLLSLIMFVAFWPNVILSFVMASIVFLGTWQALRFLFRSLWENHCNKVVEQMVEALTIMCNSLKVGLSLGQSLERVVKGYPGALAKEFNLVLNKTQLGQNLEESLEEMAERIQRTDIDMLVSTVNILKETGGNLAETFFVMSETLRERQKMQKKIKALTAQGMMQAKIISALPFLLVGVFFIIDREYIAPLIYKPLGWVCLAVIGVLVLVGWFFMKKMVEIKI